MLSASIHAQPWLKQFSQNDQRIAKMLLDELIYIESETVVDDISTYILNCVCNDDKKNVLLPIIETKALNGYVYSSTNIFEQPKLQNSAIPLGSEAFISNLYTQLNRSNPLKFPLENDKSPSLKFIKDEKIRRIIIADDLSGSGDRVCEYIKTLLNNNTIKSWLSFGFIQIHIVLYMATKTAINKINNEIRNYKRGRKEDIILHSIFDAPLLSELNSYHVIEGICINYSKSSEKWPLGYANSALRVIFSHSAPNNIPKILYQNSFSSFTSKSGVKYKKWNAIFPRRTIPRKLKKDLAVNQKSENTDVIKRLIIILKKQPLDLRHISIFLKEGITETLNILEICMCQSLIVENSGMYSLSAFGLSQSNYKCRSKISIEKKSKFYYPR